MIMDWKDKLKEIKQLFPKEEIAKEFSKRPINREQPAFDKTISETEIPIPILKKHFFRSVNKICDEFSFTKKELVKVLEIGGYSIDIKDNNAKITPGIYIYLCKTFKPDFYEKNKKNISNVLEQLLLKKSERNRKQVKKEPSPRNAKYKKHKHISEPEPTKVVYFSQNNFVSPIEIIKKIVIPFDDILFDDFAIRIKDNNHISQPYPVKEARKSFFLLRKYFKKLKFKPIEVTLQGTQIKRIENIHQLNECIEYLRIVETYFEGENSQAIIPVEKILEKLKNISNETIKPNDLNDSIEKYFNHLNAIQLTNYKIIPVIEIINTGGQILTEDTYLYTISTKNKNNIVIIWESTIHGRATYAFLSSHGKYFETLQSIFDYISSSRRAKRTSLRSKQLGIDIIDCIGYIKHQNIEQWKIKLQSLIEIDSEIAYKQK